jgi:hypothetical protein
MKVRDIRKRAKSKYVVDSGFKFLRDSQTKRCKSYVAGCVTCDTWRFYDKNGRFCRNYEELCKFMEWTEQEASCSHGTIAS